jgi:hypothetical protein
MKWNRGSVEARNGEQGLTCTGIVSWFQNCEVNRKEDGTGQGTWWARNEIEMKKDKVIGDLGIKSDGTEQGIKGSGMGGGRKEQGNGWARNEGRWNRTT